MSQLEDSLREIVREIVRQEIPAKQGTSLPLLSADDVGKRLGIDKQSVYRLHREGSLKGVNISETRFRFHPDEVDRFIRDGGVKPCPLSLAPRKLSRGGAQ